MEIIFYNITTVRHDQNLKVSDLDNSNFEKQEICLTIAIDFELQALLM